MPMILRGRLRGSMPRQCLHGHEIDVVSSILPVTVPPLRITCGTGVTGGMIMRGGAHTRCAIMPRAPVNALHVIPIINPFIIDMARAGYPLFSSQRVAHGCRMPLLVRLRTQLVRLRDTVGKIEILSRSLRVTLLASAVRRIIKCLQLSTFIISHRTMFRHVANLLVHSTL